MQQTQVASFLARAGHGITVSFARDQDRLAALDTEIGGQYATEVGPSA
jgi:hypothetical protein